MSAKPYGYSDSTSRQVAQECSESAPLSGASPTALRDLEAQAITVLPGIGPSPRLTLRPDHDDDSEVRP